MPDTLRLVGPRHPSLGFAVRVRVGVGWLLVAGELGRALRYKPDRVILLSDHLGGTGHRALKHEIDQETLLASIHAQNDVQKPAKINTIQFVNEDPLVNQGMQGTLERIADETGGSYRYIAARDLRLR